VFGVGLSRTGTTTLTQCLKILGYRVKHYYPSHVFAKPEHIESGRIGNYGFFRRRHAFTDFPTPLIYPLLDQQFPGSRFILTVRDTGDWVASLAALFRHGPKWGPWEARLNKQAYDIDSPEGFDLKMAQRAYLRHNEAVRRYFKDRPQDLLEIDITRDPRWHPLCSFLRRQIPTVQFPHLNSRAAVAARAEATVVQAAL
jgi:hypothetical protein